MSNFLKTLGDKIMFKTKTNTFEHISVFTKKKNSAMDDIIPPDGVKSNWESDTRSQLQKLIDGGWILCTNVLPKKEDSVGGRVSIVIRDGSYHTVKYEAVDSHWRNPESENRRCLAWKRIIPLS